MPLSHEYHFEELLQCNFGPLTAYQNTGENIIHGNSQDFEKVVQALSKLDEMDRDTSALDLLPSLFNIQASLDGLATYSEEVVKQLFPAVTSDILPSLINVHLHEHFLRTHSFLAVLDPIESSQHDLFRRRSMSIAEMIARCPSSPLAGKCPPNIPQCKPCKPLPVKKIPSLASLPDNAFIFGPVPHPLTLLSYLHDKSKLDPGFIRNTPRDDWLNSVTRDVVDRRMGGFQRMQCLLEYVNPHARVTGKAKIPGGYWQIWEEPDWDGLGLALGFRVAITEEATGQDEENLKFAVISAKERVLLQSTESGRDVVEAWNLAWTELWYYIRALQRRQRSYQLDLRGT